MRDQLSLQISSIAFGGDGIGRADGFVVFVPFSAIGDEILVEITERRPRHARGKIVQLLKKSEQREQPLCPYFGTCGGCQYQHLTYAEELRIKQEQIKETFRNIGGMENPPLKEIIASPDSYHYRNRITVHAEDGKIGFRGVNPQELIDIAECPISMPEVNQALKNLRERHPQNGHFSLRHPSLPPSGFFQVNHFLIETLRQLVVESFSRDVENIIEAYCGGGFFTEVLLPRFKTVIGIENDPRALKDAHRLLHSNLTLIEGDVETELPIVLQKWELAQTALLVDPPREGLTKGVVHFLSEHSPAEMTYLSCNPATLARDAKLLSEKFELISLQPIDLFPRTAQIECLSVWRKRR